MSSHSCFPSPRQPHVFESPDARNGAYATAPPPARLAPGAPPTPRPTCNDRLTQPRDRSDTKPATVAFPRRLANFAAYFLRCAPSDPSPIIAPGNRTNPVGPRFASTAADV